jgi:hypothetical protein
VVKFCSRQEFWSQLLGWAPKKQMFHNWSSENVATNTSTTKWLKLTLTDIWYPLYYCILTYKVELKNLNMISPSSYKECLLIAISFHQRGLIAAAALLHPIRAFFHKSLDSPLTISLFGRFLTCGLISPFCICSLIALSCNWYIYNHAETQANRKIQPEPSQNLGPRHHTFMILMPTCAKDPSAFAGNKMLHTWHDSCTSFRTFARSSLIGAQQTKAEHIRYFSSS